MHKMNTWNVINEYMEMYELILLNLKQNVCSVFFYLIVYVREWWRESITGRGDSMYKNEYLGGPGCIFDNLLPSSPLNSVRFWNLPQVYNLSFAYSSCAL